jgi:hypothetical protein
MEMREQTDRVEAEVLRTSAEVRPRANPWRRFLRKAHGITGVVLALNFLFVVITGVLIEHRELLRLEERTVSRTWLPSDYRPLDGDEVRADIVITDLHSGRLFGPYGPIVVDVLGLGGVVLVTTGAVMYFSSRRRRSGT